MLLPFSVMVYMLSHYAPRSVRALIGAENGIAELLRLFSISL